MSSTFVADSIAAASSEIKVWPKDVVIYQPPIDNFLLSDLANSRITQGLLRLHGLSYDIEARPNAEFMTASGTVPFLKVERTVIGKDALLKFLQLKGYSFIQDFPDELKLKAMSYLSYIEDIVAAVELYSSWIVPENLKQTQAKYSYGQPKILGYLLFNRKRFQMRHYLTLLNWQKKTVDQVEKVVSDFCMAITQKLTENKYLMGDSPCEVDIILVGHLMAAVQYKQPNPFYANVISNFPVLVDYCKQFSLEAS